MSTQLGNDYTWLPIWFRLQRLGNTFLASQSSDGVTWFVVGKSIVPMASKYLVGLTVTSGSASREQAGAIFDHVMMSVAPPRPPGGPSDLVASHLSSNAIKLNWTNSTGAQDGVKIECSTDNTLFYEIADLRPGTSSFVNTGLSPVPLHYRIRAYNTGGYSAYSNIARAIEPGGGGASSRHE